MTTAKIPVFLIVLSFAGASTLVTAEEVVYFTNGAEMTVHSHTVVNGTVKLDLGDNSFIAFPMAMVDRIDGAGQNAFVNPGFHPTNQVVAEGAGGTPVLNAKYSGGPSGGAADLSAVGKASPGWAAPSTGTGREPVMLGDVAGRQPVISAGDPRPVQSDSERYQRFLNPAGSAPAAGGHPLMMPQSLAVTAPKRLMPVPSSQAPPPATGVAGNNASQ